MSVSVSRRFFLSHAQTLLPLSLSTRTWQQCPAVSSSQPEIHVWRRFLRGSGVEQHSNDLKSNKWSAMCRNIQGELRLQHLVQTLYHWWWCAEAPPLALSPLPGCCSKTAGWSRGRTAGSSTLWADCSTSAAVQPASLMTGGVSRRGCFTGKLWRWHFLSFWMPYMVVNNDVFIRWLSLTVEYRRNHYEQLSNDRSAILPAIFLSFSPLRNTKQECCNFLLKVYFNTLKYS